MRKKYIDLLFSGGWITREQYDQILSWQKDSPFTLHWELRTLLYTGVMLLTSGLGVIIYKNIDTIGHTAIILAIAAACGTCFLYCFRHKLPYSNLKTSYENPWFDYVLLLGCLLFLALEGYLQFRYQVFGTRFGIATLVPALLFFCLAYRFDHIGVLSMAITALASYAGITASPGLLLGNSLSEASLVYTGIALSVLLIAAGFFMKEKEIKRHFTFTYYNFGFNLYFISMLCAMFTLEISYLYFGLLLTGCVLLIRYAIREQSFYFLLLPVIYGYIGITWLIFRLGMGGIIGLYYFVISCGLVIWFFINYKKILRIK